MPQYIVFKIAIADGSGVKGGTIHVDGDHGLGPASMEGPDEPLANVAFPEGTHSIRWTDPTWMWLKNNEVVTSDMIYSSDSPEVVEYWEGEGADQFGPVPVYTYTGGPLDGPMGIPYFEFPLAGKFENGMPPADLVDTLVVQVMSTDEIEYLDKDESPVHPPIEPEVPDFPDPPSSDPCEL